MSEDDAVLYDYWRSSASYRVRIALNLLGLPYTRTPVDLLAGEQGGDNHRALNPQGLVPTLVLEGTALTQSLAIIEYLHERTAGSTLLPDDAAGRFRVRQLSYVVAMEIHPMCNLSVVRRVSDIAGSAEPTTTAWMQHFIGKGLQALEDLLALTDGPFCHGAVPTMADCCLIPQLYNAKRWGVETGRLARITEAEAAASALEAFQAAQPVAVGPLPD
ncbi:MAG: maleylacetoacetate isomerase [Pseudomonadota bacterium]